MGAVDEHARCADPVWAAVRCKAAPAGSAKARVGEAALDMDCPAAAATAAGTATTVGRAAAAATGATAGKWPGKEALECTEAFVAAAAGGRQGTIGVGAPP
mmetsp:Transcript_81649/g.264532  ORF Transcript_81649/g.264532 Transcript_81649/m.264532 type:complete len:101 (-) Transcript_81649:1300-1602(-)